MTERQEKLQAELNTMRRDFINRHNLKCENCEYWEKKRKNACSSKVYCIVRDGVFNCNYKEREK